MKIQDLKSLPSADGTNIESLLSRELGESNEKIVVLDDDPTGVQTVHDISVYTSWEQDTILEGFREKGRMFFVLTNSRGLTAEQTEQLHRQIALHIIRASEQTGKPFILISRSDSTLRGHYPLETSVMREVLEKNGHPPIDGEILAPVFPEGGRFTYGDVHYVKLGDELVPANETEFAADPTFGYSAASMPEYVEEKTRGAFSVGSVICIGQRTLGEGNIDLAAEQLRSASDFRKIIVNAVSYADLKVFSAALLRVIREGRHFMLRSAAALVKVLGGVSNQPLLTGRELLAGNTSAGGIVIVGSHTERTGRQLQCLLELPEVDGFEMNVALVRDKEQMDREISRCIRLEEDSVRKGRIACIYTSRTVITADTGDKEDELRLSVAVSGAVRRLISELNTAPGYIIAKGGITSSEIGVHALGVKRAEVAGQILPGVPVWRTGNESRFPGIPYIIFPGNVGEDTSLRDAVLSMETV